MSGFKSILALSAMAALSSTAAQADFTISSAPTSDVTCSAGVCTGATGRAVLNATELMSMLATGDVTLTDVRRKAGFSVQAQLFWSSSHTLTIHSPSTLIVGQSISVTGTGGLDISAANDAAITYASGASISFWDTSSHLTINGHAYNLVDGIAGLAAAPSGYVALAKSYDAAADGIYAQTPVGGTNNTLDGLGNTIANLQIHDTMPGRTVGLMYGAKQISHLHLTNVNIKGSDNASVGGIAGSGAKMLDDSVTGTVETGATLPNAQQGSAGGLAGQQFDPVQNSSADVTVVGGTNSYVGALIGYYFGSITFSHSNGSVTSAGGAASAAGGLVGYSGIVEIGTTSSGASVSGARYGGGLVGYTQGVNFHQDSAAGSVSGGDGATLGGLFGYMSHTASSVDNCFATGSVTDTASGIVGGLVGENIGDIRQSYATGAVSGAGTSSVGGLVGINHRSIQEAYATGAVNGPGGTSGGLIGIDSNTGEALADTFFDITTSGMASAQGAGNVANDPGIAGLTNKQLKAGLPGQFGAAWGQSRHINHGWPYLLSWPPG